MTKSDMGIASLYLIAFALIGVACTYYVTHVPAWATVVVLIALFAYTYLDPRGV